MRRLASLETGKRGNYHDKSVIETESRDFAIFAFAPRTTRVSTVSTVSTVGSRGSSARGRRGQIEIVEELRRGGKLPILFVVLVFALFGVPFQGLEEFLPLVFVLEIRRGRGERRTMMEGRSIGISPELMATTVVLKSASSRRRLMASN